jgi:ABC-2 type transport system permease protein
MHETTVVLRRELKSYFLSPIAYVFGGLFLGLLAFFASLSSFRNGAPASMQGFFALLPMVFLFFLPALTMRLWAEERKLGTLELLMTFPVRISQLIAGKFLAAMIYLTVVMLFTLGIPLTLGTFGTLDWLPVAGAYLASLLMAAAYVSVGMFWSSMTRDQIIAMLLALITLVALFFLGTPQVLEAVASFLPALVIDILSGISPNRYFDSISRGVIDSRDILYYLCFCGFFLHLNALVLNARRRKG